jgi:mannose-6-phosphate isomerase-like protein (cupin superfamily)
METIGGATVVLPDPGGPAAEAARGPAVVGPDRTAGVYLALVGALAAGDAGPPLHVHPFTDELFYVGEGEITFTLGDRDVVAGPGTCVFVPRGTAHTARNAGSGPARGLILISPGTAEHATEPVEA